LSGEIGIVNALISAKEIAFEMNIKSKLRKKCIRGRKKQFDKNVENEIVKSFQ